MKLIVGLGNPTKDYTNTRHNLGASTLIKLAGIYFDSEEKWKKWENAGLILDLNLPKERVKLFRPSSYMNLSGAPIKKICSFYKIEPPNLWLVHDELDLPLGVVRLSFGSSAAGHNGVQNIIDELGSKNFWRFRLGIGKPPINIPNDKFVLLPFSPTEQTTIDNFIMESAKKIAQALDIGPEIFSSKFNQ